MEKKQKPSAESGKKIPRLMTVKQFCQEFDWPTASGMRVYIYHSDTNGFAHCFVKVGRRVLIDVDAFFEEVLKGRGGQAR